jgi:hypothetical protein
MKISRKKGTKEQKWWRTWARKNWYNVFWQLSMNQPNTYPGKSLVMASGIQTDASMKTTVFWDVAPCSLIEVYRCFRGAFCLQHQTTDYQTTWRNISEDGHLHIQCHENLKSHLHTNMYETKSTVMPPSINSASSTTKFILSSSQRCRENAALLELMRVGWQWASNIPKL